MDVFRRISRQECSRRSVVIDIQVALNDGKVAANLNCKFRDERIITKYNVKKNYNICLFLVAFRNMMKLYWRCLPSCHQ